MTTEETVTAIKHFNLIIYNSKNPELRDFFEREKEILITSHKEKIEHIRLAKKRSKQRSISDTLELVGTQ